MGTPPGALLEEKVADGPQALCADSRLEERMSVLSLCGPLALPWASRLGREGLSPSYANGLRIGVVTSL